MEKLIEQLRHFQHNLSWQRRELFERSVGGQRPTALFVTCSDSRVLPETLMQADPGDLFVSRNAGNIIPPPGVPGGEGATIEYAVNALGVTDIVVCGHYRCGAVKALLWPSETETLPKVTEWLAHAAETKALIGMMPDRLDGESLWDRAVELNVLVQVGNLATHPAVAAALAAGRVRLHAWVLRFETGEVFARDPVADTFSPLLDMPVVRPVIPAPGGPTPAEELPWEGVPSRRPPGWFEAAKGDVPASLAVFAVALPLCVAIAAACGQPTAAGILTAVIGGVVVGMAGGGPLQVSGPTAGLIVILIGVGDRLGLASLGLVVFLAGLIQIAAGFLRLGQWFRAISPAVILGMLAGIGVVLFAQQFHVAVDDPAGRSALMNLAAVPAALLDSFDGHPGHPGHQPAALVGLLTLAVLLLWGPFLPTRLKAVPGVLVAVVTATAVTALLGLPIQRVEFDGLAAAVKVFDFASLPESLGSAVVWQSAFTVAVVATSETLLTAAAVDRMSDGKRTHYDRELAAQGLGNALCGLIGALPMAGVIVRSSANVQAGARTRWSAVLHGVWMLAFVLLLPGVLRLLPTAALAAVLVLTGVRLVQVRAIRALWKESREEAMICVATAATVVAFDLLAGVLLGMGLSLFKLTYAFSRLRIRRRGDGAGGRMTLILEGTATFIRLPKLAAALEAVPPGAELYVDFKGMSYIDHACMDLLVGWEERHRATGGRLVLDWVTLRARFSQSLPRPQQDSAGRVRPPDGKGPA